MSENLCKDLMIIPQPPLTPNDVTPVVETVPVIVDAQGVVHYHARIKPPKTKQIVMQATHWLYFVRLTEWQYHHTMYPLVLTEEENAAEKAEWRAVYGKMFLYRFLAIFALLCVVTTDNFICSGTAQLFAAVVGTLNPLTVACFAEPLRAVAFSFAQLFFPACDFVVETLRALFSAVREVRQTLRPGFSAITSFLGEWTPQFLKNIKEHQANVWRQPMRNRRQEIREVLVYSLPNHLNCFGKFGWAAIIVDTAYLFLALCVLRKRPLIYFYLFLKILFFALPLLYISPYDRLPFWPFVLFTTALECWIGVSLIISHGQGHEWHKASFTIYRTWSKHFKYQKQTSDSENIMDRSRETYLIVKVLLAFNFWCYTDFMYKQRVKYPHVGTNAFANANLPVGYKTPQQLAKEAAARAADEARIKKAKMLEEQLAAYVQAKRNFYNQLARDHYDRAERIWLENYGEADALLDKMLATGDLRPANYNMFKAVLLPRPKLDDYINYYHTRRPRLYARDPFYDRRVNKASILPDLDYFNTLIEQDTAVNLKYGLLFILALSSLTVYSIILAGWSSNSKYAFIGALRSAAQMISYEVAISLILLPIVLMAGSLNITMIVYMQSITVWFLFPLLPAAVLFIIAMLAETNRTPFDLPEAEAELVAGYNVDYSALPFAMFFLGEYCNMILISILFCLLFLGGWSFFGYYGVLILVVKAVLVWFYFIHVRATLPRYRYDQLMDNGWKTFLPIAGGFFIFIVGALIGLDALPVTTELPLQEISRFSAACLAVSSTPRRKGLLLTTSCTTLLPWYFKERTRISEKLIAPFLAHDFLSSATLYKVPCPTSLKLLPAPTTRTGQRGPLWPIPLLRYFLFSCKY